MPISMRVDVTETVGHGMRDGVRFAIPYWNQTGTGGKMTGPVVQGGVAKFKITSGAADKYRLICANGDLTITPRGRDACDVRFNGRLDVTIDSQIPSFLVNSFGPMLAASTLRRAADFIDDQLTAERQAKPQRGTRSAGDREVA